MATAVLVGFILGFTASSAFDPTANAQIMARTAPRLVDLSAALATGLAGAFAIGRKDVSDTLPGVAIAISLVPPLTNAGILFSAGEPDLACGQPAALHHQLLRHPDHRHPGLRAHGLPRCLTGAQVAARPSRGRRADRGHGDPHRRPAGPHQPGGGARHDRREPGGRGYQGLAGGHRLPVRVGDCAATRW